MLLCSPHLSRILSAFERMLGSAVNEPLSLEMFPELIGSERDPGLQLEMRRQTSSRPDAEEIPVGIRSLRGACPRRRKYLGVTFGGRPDRALSCRLDMPSRIQRRFQLVTVSSQI